MSQKAYLGFTHSTKASIYRLVFIFHSENVNFGDYLTAVESL